MLQGQRVAASFCAQGASKLSSCLAEVQRQLFCAAQSQERFDRESAQRADQAY